MEPARTVGDVGALARAARSARGWTQQQAADAANVSRRFVNMLEGGRHANAEVGRVLALLDALGVHLTGTLPARDSAATPASPTSEPDPIDLDAFVSSFRTPPEAS